MHWWGKQYAGFTDFPKVFGGYDNSLTVLEYIWSGEYEHRCFPGDTPSENRRRRINNVNPTSYNGLHMGCIGGENSTRASLTLS